MSETTYADAREAIENALYRHNIHGDMADIILSHLAKVRPAATGDGELLPCPFCGAAGVAHGEWGDNGYWANARCSSNECPAALVVDGKDEDDATARWNTRPRPAAEREGEAMGAAAIGLGNALHDAMSLRMDTVWPLLEKHRNEVDVIRVQRAWDAMVAELRAHRAAVGAAAKALRELSDSVEYVLASRNEVDPAPANQRFATARANARALLSATPAPQPAAPVEVSECLRFFASVIKSGEPWTETCQRMYDAALECQRGGK